MVVGELVKQIIKATVKQLSDFRRTTTSIFRNFTINTEYTKKEVSEIKRFKEDLNDAKSKITDKIKLYNIKLFLDTFDIIIKDLEKGKMI